MREFYSRRCPYLRARLQLVHLGSGLRPRKGTNRPQTELAAQAMRKYQEMQKATATAEKEVESELQITAPQ